MSGLKGDSPRRAGFNFAPILAMSEILKLRGAPALSSSRLARLTDSVKAVLPRLKGLAAEHWYFAEVSAPLTADELSRLVDLLGVHPEGDAPAGTLLMVTPRLGTISPWSSKATDIAHQCGFDKIVRVERGTALSFDLRGGLDARDRAAVLPAIHDRMTESVLDNPDAAHALFHHYAPQPLTTVDILARGRDALVAAIRTARSVVVKILHAEACRTPAYIERFRHIAERTMLLSHRHLAAVHAFGVLQSGSEGERGVSSGTGQELGLRTLSTSAQGIPWIATDPLEGPDLRSYLTDGIAPETLLSLLTPLADALDQAAALGLCHGELLPQNLILIEEPEHDHHGRHQGHQRRANHGLPRCRAAGRAFRRTGSACGRYPRFRAPGSRRGRPARPDGAPGWLIRWSRGDARGRPPAGRRSPFPLNQTGRWPESDGPR